jgi:hypothetical protein
MQISTALLEQIRLFLSDTAPDEIDLGDHEQALMEARRLELIGRIGEALERRGAIRDTAGGGGATQTNR